jgi:ferredoxin
VAGADGAFACRTDQRVLEAMMGTMFGLPGAPTRPNLRVGCRRGGCGACRVRILDGQYDTEAMSAAHVTANDRLAGFALACCLYPRSDLVLEPAPKSGATTTGTSRP